MHEGNIGEMERGEGKRVSGRMALYLNGLRGKRGFLIRSND
ncbi:hypothetical protein [Staphylococcus capitis]|nr:hypothetical protein [Staphylococcus capitis]